MSKPLVRGLSLLFLPLALFIIFVFVNAIHVALVDEVASYDISSFSQTSSLAPYPVLTYPYVPGISAQSAVVLDDASKVFIYQKNPDVRFSMASTTKIMTALVAVEQYALTDALLVYRDHVAGSTAGLKKGEKYTFESLLYAMLLPSANDAAQVIADNYPGGSSAFVKRMNEKALELQLFDTQYNDPAGLDDDENYTTARDLANLSIAAMKSDVIARVAGTKVKTISDLSRSHIIPLENLNELLGVNGVVGIKTGFTEGAGGVLVTARKEQGHTQILVVMKSVDRFGDTSALLSLISGNITYIRPTYTPLSMYSDVSSR